MAGAYSGYSIKRYMDETRRLFDVLESRLKDADWLAGDKYTLADIASYSWVQIAPLFLDIKLDEWSGIKRWVQRIDERPAVKKALEVPSGPRDMEMFGGWVKDMVAKVEGMKDTEKHDS